jgi:hypothetical protein
MNKSYGIKKSPLAVLEDVLKVVSCNFDRLRRVEHDHIFTPLVPPWKGYGVHTTLPRASCQP